jgi:catechol 2,3-dioxygenase-like lactoylglutathione lyase family enzyme
MAVSHINFVSIPVDDQDRAIAFYRDALGFAVTTDAPYAPGWRWIFLSLPGGQARLQFARRGEVAVTDVPALTLVCDSVDDLAADLRHRGHAVADGPADAPWAPGVRWMMLIDSEGNRVLLESFHA